MENRNDNRGGSNSGYSRPYNSSNVSSGNRESGSRYGNSGSGNRSTGSSYNRPSSSSSYNGNRSSFNSGRPSYGSNRSGGGYRGGGRRSGGGARKPSAMMMDPNTYIKKAIESVEKVEYIPKNTFNDFKIDEGLRKNILSKGYELPTPIQDKTIDFGLQGKDVIGEANTGTGKTAAFLIPLIDKVIKKPNQRVIIMAPTRELALQISEEFRTFVKGFRIYSVDCIGGSSISNQISQLRRNPNFVIGTPGRIKDLINRRVLNLSSFSNVVLDEADRMVDMGFIDDIKYILSQLSTERQSLFFSATISKEINELIRAFLKEPEFVSVKSRPTSENVDQDVVHIKNGISKVDALHDILTKPEADKVLIFVKTKIGAERLDRELYQRGFKVASIHGDKSQYQRQQAIVKFKNGTAKILVATDVAARGLDIPNVTHVINYDVPATLEDYIHRIGRTGRANKKGNALTFIEENMSRPQSSGGFGGGYNRSRSGGSSSFRRSSGGFGGGRRSSFRR